eukprot:snap_masked-scaffold_108-processed-gene-0.0-mRNA-1 protein AED:1.00 eAED:1.00 QI:0/-1/0/0/-1/1/1/0/617
MTESSIKKYFPNIRYCIPWVVAVVLFIFLNVSSISWNPFQVEEKSFQPTGNLFLSEEERKRLRMNKSRNSYFILDIDIETPSQSSPLRVCNLFSNEVSNCLPLLSKNILTKYTNEIFIYLPTFPKFIKNCNNINFSKEHFYSTLEKVINRNNKLQLKYVSNLEDNINLLLDSKENLFCSEVYTFFIFILSNIQNNFNNIRINVEVSELKQEILFSSLIEENKLSLNISSLLSSSFISLTENIFDTSIYKNLFTISSYLIKDNIEEKPKDNTCKNQKYSGESFCCYKYFEHFECMPNTILLGVQKGSTGELALWMSKNPEITRYGSEVHFFDKDLEKKTPSSFSNERINILESYKKGKDTPAAKLMIPPKQEKNIISEYLFQITRSDRKRRISGVQVKDLLDRKQLLFEKTPAYFDEIHPKDLSSALKQTFNPQVLVILRDPATRFHSAYFHNCKSKPIICDKNGFTMFTDNALASKKKSNAGLRALSYGLYYLFLESWIEEFSSLGIKFMILFTEEFKKDPFKTIWNLETELNIDHFNYKEGNHVQKVNGYWIISEGSKAVKESKPETYFKLNEYPEYEIKLKNFYNRSNSKLKILLEKKNKTGEISLVNSFPDWLN